MPQNRTKIGCLHYLLLLMSISLTINVCLCNLDKEKSDDGEHSKTRIIRQIPDSPTLSDFVKMYNKIMQMEERLGDFMTKTDGSIDKADKEVEANREYIYNLGERLIMLEDQIHELNSSFAKDIKALKDSGQGNLANNKSSSVTRKPTTTTNASSTTTTRKPTTKRVSTTMKRSTAAQTVTFAPTSKDEFSIVCHYDTFASTAKGGSKFQPEDIDAKLCTDIVYDSAILDESKLLIKSKNPELDIEKNFYRRVTGLKKNNSNLKVYLSIGGWADSAGDKYSQLARTEQKRRGFARDVVNFLKKYGFDGLDFSWMYPVCWQSNCNAGVPEDRLNYVRLLEELRGVFDQQNPPLLLSAVVHAHSFAINKIYHVPAIVDLLDRIEVKTYGYKYPSDDKTSHLAPLNSYRIGHVRMASIKDSIDYWLKLHVPPKKLFLAVPAYGRTFTLVNPTVNGLGAPTTGPGAHINYNHVCEKLKQSGWTVVSDIAAGSYAFKGKEWIGYVGPEDAARLAKFAREKNLGGVTLWDITDDDYNTYCCSERYPLLKTLNMVLWQRERGGLKQLGCPATATTNTRTSTF